MSIVVDGWELTRKWGGDEWRRYPAPTLGTEGPTTRPASVRERVKVVSANRARVREALRAEWQTVAEIAATLGMTAQGVRRHIRDAMTDGVADGVMVASAGGGRRPALQVRRRRGEGAA